MWDGGAQADLLGEGPQEGRPCSGEGHDHLMRMFAACPEVPVALTQADRRRPPEVLAAFREVFPAELPMAAHGGRIAIRPGAFDQGPAGRRVAGVRDAALAPPFPTGVCRRRQAQVTHELAGGSNTGQVAPFGDDGDGHGDLDTPQGLEGLDHRGQTPSVHRLVACLVQTLEAFGVFGTGPHVCLADDWLGWGRTDHGREPPEVGRAPSGLARLAQVLPEAKGVEAACGGVELAPGIVASAAPVPAGVVRDLGDIAGVSAPERLRRASWTASRRSVLTRSPACCGSREGATTQQTAPCFVSSRERQDPQAPAAETKTRGLLCECRFRMSRSRSPWRVPLRPRETTSAPSSLAP